MEIRNFIFPLPSAIEQKRIALEVERQLGITDEIANLLSLNLKRSMLLRQSILEQAFTGKLVPQDPSDEPASVLLEKIKVEREKAVSVKKTLPKAIRGRTRVKQT